VALAAGWLAVLCFWPTTHAAPLAVSSAILSADGPVSPVSAVVGPAGDDIDPLASRRPRPSGTATTAPPAAQPRAPISVTAIGDSVMLDALPALRGAVAGIDVDAVVGRQFSAGLADVMTRLATGRLGQEVILGLGTNGPIAPPQFDEMMRLLRGRRVIVVNAHVARPWESEVNGVLADGVAHWPNAVLVDWYTFSLAHPELFTSDGIHLGGAAGQVYASLVVRAL
jgi:hypothetical protein